MAFKLVNGLLPIIIKKEDKFGVPVLDFSDHDGVINGLPVNQSVDNPVNVTDTYNKEVIKSTFGSQIQKEGVQRLGQRTVSTSIGHDLGLNDFVVIGNMFFQNGYTYTDVITGVGITDEAIVSITDNTGSATIEVADVTSLLDGDSITLSNRLASDEDGTYTVSNVDVNLNTFDITIIDIATTLEGTINTLKTRSTFVSITDNTGSATIEVSDVGTLKNGNVVIIEDRDTVIENDSYVVSNVTATTFDITITDMTETTEGFVSCVLGIHESLIEDVNDCAAQELTNSYSIFIPEKFADNDGDCGTSQGNIINGVVPTVLNVDFVESNYSADFIAKSYEDYGDKSPRVEADYNLPTADGFMRQNFASLQYWDGTDFVNLETMGLDITITLGTEDSQKVRKAGELSRAIVDGVEITGNYSALYLTEDDLNNKSNSLYANRTSLENGGLFRIAVENTSGESIYIEGNIKFYNETLKPELGGFLFSTEFQFLRSVANPNVKLTCINNYKQHLSNLL